eukprot:TRINITY_DN11627_c1_g1_i1.p1 TRINITY_DN11627_c1_g1~~TRINITY_DN11627_c1_g1_i1.p1  ORF type:complete len:291 (+),score=112.85 TRINITY_DN11627_c1_g1_i1:55-927(+)
MSKTTFFKDLGKAGSDLLEKDFPTDSWTVEAESKAPNDVKFKTTGAKKAEGVSGSIEQTATFKEQGTTVKATLKTDKTYSAEVTVEDKVVEGLKTVLFGENKGDKNTVKATFDYKNASVGTFSSTVTYPFKANPSVAASFTTGYEALTFGASGEFALGNKSGLTRYAAKFVYNGPSFKFVGSYSAKPSEEALVGLTYHHVARSDVELVGDISVDTAKLSDAPRLTFGAQWKRDAFTTVKSKIVSDSSKLAFSVQQKLSDNATVVVGSESTLSNLSSGGSHKVGATLKLGF